MTTKDITTWSVSKGVAIPKNNIQRFVYAETFGYGDPYTYENDEWKTFEKEAQQHTYATNAPDGSYSADCFGEIVWQFMNVKFEWNYCMNNDPGFSDDHGFSTRQFLPFIDQVKEAEIITLNINDFTIAIEDIERAFCYGYLANPENDCLDSAEMMRSYELFKINYLTPMLSRKGIID